MQGVRQTWDKVQGRIIARTTLMRSADSVGKKSDRKDAKMLARNVAFGTCRFVGIPDEVDMENRGYISMRASHKKAPKKVKQQILAFCLRCGERSSAGVGPNMGITKFGNAVVRTQLIESSQTLIKGNPGKKSKRTMARQPGKDVRVIARWEWGLMNDGLDGKSAAGSVKAQS